MKEKTDLELKAKSRDWWSSFSQDYVEPGEMDHLGAPIHLDDREFAEYINKIDTNFQLDGYFAQSKGQPLFSSLLPKLYDGANVLEVGCGLGAHSEQICKAGGSLTAIDLAPMSIDFTRRRLEQKNLAATVIEGDCENLPFPDDTFDFVWSWGVIHHSPNTKKCADEIVRVLKPGGELRIMLYNSHSLYHWVNVIVRYGVMRGKLLTHSLQDLKNRYTDGKKAAGAPLSKYYSAAEVRNVLFQSLEFSYQTCFEQKHAFTFWLPTRFQRRVQILIPNSLYTFLWKKFGFLLFSVAHKPKTKPMVN